MDRLKAYLIDDEPAALTALRWEAEKVLTIEIVGQATSFQDALTFINSNEVDFLFLDIDMPGMTGIEFLKQIKKKAIFVTADKEAIYEALSNENAIDYITKPIQFDRLLIAISRAETALKKDPPRENYYSELVIGKMVIELGDVQLIQATASNCWIHTASKKHLMPIPINQLEPLLPPDQFSRVHKSFIVPLSQIAKKTSGVIQLVDGHAINIGRQYKGRI